MGPLAALALQLILGPALAGSSQSSVDKPAIQGTSPQVAETDAAGRGDAAWTKQDYAAARAAYLEAVPALEKSAPGSPELVRIYFQLAKIENKFGDLPGAEGWLLKWAAVDEVAKPGSPELAQIYATIAQLWLTSSTHERAEKWLRKVIAIRERIERNSEDLATCYGNLGTILADRGDLEGAERLHRKALAISLASGTDPHQSYINLGVVSGDRYAYEDAQSWFQKAYDVLVKDPSNRHDLAIVEANLVDNEIARGNLDAAMDWERKARALLEEEKPGPLLVQCYQGLGNIARRRGENAGAESWFQKAIGIVQPVAPRSLTLAHLYQDISAVAYDQNRPKAGMDWCSKALQIEMVTAPGSLDIALIHSNLGTFLCELGRYKEARSMFELAAREKERQRSKMLSPQRRSLISGGFDFDQPYYARTLIELNDVPAAVQLLEGSKARGVAEAFASRSFPMNTPEIRDLDRQLDGCYAALAVSQDDDRAVELRGMISVLLAKKAEAEDAFRKSNPKLASMAYPRPLDLAGIQKLLDPQTACLHYILGDRFGYVVVVTRSSAKAFPIGAGDREVLASMASFINVASHGSLQIEIKRAGVTLTPIQAGTLTSGKTTRSWNRSIPMTGSAREGRRLYSWLVKPALPGLEPRIRRLLICPDKVLDILPFAALPAGGGKYLADRVAIVSVPSVTTLAQIRREQRRSPSKSLLAFGDPAYRESEEPSGTTRAGEPSVPNRKAVAVKRGLRFGPLPSTRKEVTAIAALYHTQPLMGPAATVSTLLSRAGGARFLHLACHGFEDHIEPLASSVVLSPEKGSDGILPAWQVMRDLHLSADLVVLSACATGLGRTEGNEGLNGLTRAFQFAGAKSVLASGWSVDDASTADFMKFFYLALKSGQARDVALRSAELRLRKSHPDPYYWAPFTLFGDWK